MPKGTARYAKTKTASIVKAKTNNEKLDPKNIERLEMYKRILIGIDWNKPSISKKDKCEMCGETYNGKFFQYIGYSETMNMVICSPCTFKRTWGLKYKQSKAYIFMKSMGVF